MDNEALRWEHLESTKEQIDKAMQQIIVGEKWEDVVSRVIT